MVGHGFPGGSRLVLCFFFVQSNIFIKGKGRPTVRVSGDGQKLIERGGSTSEERH